MGRKVMWALKALLVSYLVTVVLLMILTLLMYKFEFGEKVISTGIIAIYVLSTLTGGILIGKMSGRRRFLWGIGLGVLYFLLLLLITFGIYRTVNVDMTGFVSTWILCIGGGMIGGMIS